MCSCPCCWYPEGSCRAVSAGTRWQPSRRRGGTIERGQITTSRSRLTRGRSWSCPCPATVPPGTSGAITDSPDQNVLAETSYFPILSPWLIGAGGEEHWVFQAVGAGTTGLSLAYARPWENAQPAKTYSVVIGVNSTPARTPPQWNHASFTIGGQHLQRQRAGLPDG